MMGMHDFQYNMLTTNFNIVGHSLVGGQLRLMTGLMFGRRPVIVICPSREPVRYWTVTPQSNPNCRSVKRLFHSHHDLTCSKPAGPAHCWFASRF